MVNKSLYDLETWAIIDKWFLILHECLSREVRSFYFLPSLSSFCVKKQIEKIILWLKNVCSVLFVCKTRDLAICMYTSDSVIHSTVIWRFASVQGRIKGRVSFCYTDRNDFKKLGDGARMDFLIYLFGSYAWVLLNIFFVGIFQSMIAEFPSKEVKQTPISSWMTCGNECQFHLKQSKNADLMHLFIDISLFSTRPHRPFARYLHRPSTT